MKLWLMAFLAVLSWLFTIFTIVATFFLHSPLMAGLAGVLLVIIVELLDSLKERWKRDLACVPQSGRTNGGTP